MEINFGFETEVSKIIEHLKNIELNEKIENNLKKRTVIMAPDIGGKDKIGEIDKRNYKLRVYSHGGRILELTTQPQRKAKNKYIPNKAYIEKNEKEENGKPKRSDYIPISWSDEKYEKVRKMRGALEYVNTKEDDLINAIEIAKVRGELIAEERSLETYLVYKNRSERCKGTIIDMEFNCPKDWLLEKEKRIDYTSSTGKPDLIVFDSKTNSFGLIELKYKNKSTENIVKHFVDFFNIVNGKSTIIKEEFKRKIMYLKHYGLINIDITDEDLNNAVQAVNNIWVGFLFIDGDEGKSYDVYEDGYEEFNQLRIESETSKGVKLPPIEIGFCYYTDKNVRMDFNKEAFCFKHE